MSQREREGRRKEELTFLVRSTYMHCDSRVLMVYGWFMRVNRTDGRLCSQHADQMMHETHCEANACKEKW